MMCRAERVYICAFFSSGFKSSYSSVRPISPSVQSYEYLNCHRIILALSASVSLPPTVDEGLLIQIQSQACEAQLLLVFRQSWKKNITRFLLTLQHHFHLLLWKKTSHNLHLWVCSRLRNVPRTERWKNLQHLKIHICCSLIQGNS